MNAPSGHVVAAAPRFFAERIALLFCAPMLVAGIALPYFPVWLNTLSLSDVEIGIVLAVPMIMRVVTAPIAGVIADRIGERTVVLVWSAILSFATALALFAADSFWPVLLLFSLQGAVFAPYMPIADAIALSGVRRSLRGRFLVGFGLRLLGRLGCLVLLALPALEVVIGFACRGLHS